MTNYRFLVVLGCAIAFQSVGLSQEAPKAKKAGRQVINASFDKTGQHPGTAPISGPATITCLSATSRSPTGQPKPSCFVVAPGYTGNLAPQQKAGASGAGTVTLNCNGQGDVLKCSAAVQ